MTAKTVAAIPGSCRRPHRLPSAEGGTRTLQSAVTDVMQQEVMYEVAQALTDDDSAGQG